MGSSEEAEGERKMLARCKGGATATWRVHQSGEREWGGGRGRRRACWVSGGPPARTPPTHSLGSPRRRGGVPAAGRLLPPGWSWARGVGCSPFPGADVSFSSLRMGERVRGVWAMISIIILSAFWRSGSAAGDRGRAGRPAATARGWRTGGLLVSRGGRRSRLWPADGLALLVPRRPSHSALPADDPLLPAPLSEVSKVNEKFHP